MKKLLIFPALGMAGLTVVGLSYFVVGIALAAVLLAILAVPVLAGIRMFGPRLYDTLGKSTYLE